MLRDAEGTPSGVVVGESAQPCGGGVDVAGREQAPLLEPGEHLEVPGGAGRDHGQSAGHRFEHREAEALERAAREEHARPIHEGGKSARISEEVDGIADAQLGRERFECRLLRARARRS